MNSLLSTLQSTYPPDTGVRVGMADLDTDGVTVIVLVDGQPVDCGFLDTTTSPGNPVALLRCGPTWLCLGQIQVQP
jgi:hypothetical protein